MNSQYQEKAIPLISVDQASGKYILTDEGRDFIKSVPGPIGVISVAGLYRTGKSYLLNRMILNRSSGFGVGPTVNPCTKGLWCWGTPIKGQSADGQKLNIIVIDTEGIGALDEDQTHDTRIFTLAILASSCFIYNSTGSIDENAVQNLSLVVNLTKHIQLNTDNNSDEDPDKIANYFPKFFWVVRDFSLQMVDSEGNQLNSRQYLQKALAPQKGISDDTEQKNRIRRILTSFFKERQCITLVRPLIDETKLQELDGLQFDHLRPEFVKKVMELRRNITSKMKPKTLNNQKLNGNLYWSMLTSYVGAINNGAVPNIQNAWHYMCQEQCTKIVNQSYEVFEKMIKDIKIPCSSEEIDKGLEKAQQSAIQFYKKESIGEQADHFYRELAKKIKDRISKIKSVNAQEGKMSFKKYLNPFMNAISQKINKQEYDSIEQFIQEIKKLQQKITKEEPKFVDWKLFLQMSAKRMLEQGSMHLMKRVRNQKEQYKKSSQETMKIKQNQLQILKKQTEGDKSTMMEQIQKMEKQKVELKIRIECLESEMNETDKQKTTEIQKLTQKLAIKKKEVEQKEAELNKKITAANSKAGEVQIALQTAHHQWQKQKAIMKQQLQHNEELINELQKKKQNTQAKLEIEKSEISKKYGEQLMNERQNNEKLTRDLSNFKEINESLSKQVEQFTEKLEILTRKSQSDEKKYKEDIMNKTREVQRLNNERQYQISKIRNQFQQQQDETQKNMKQMEEKLKKSQLKMKELKNDLSGDNTKLKHQVAILTQQYAQIQIENQDNKAKIADLKRIHEAELQAWETNRGMYQEQQIANKINDLQANHLAEMQSLKSEQQKENEKSLLKISQLKAQNNDYQLENKLLKEKVSISEKSLNDLQEKMNLQIDALNKCIKNMERQHKTTLLSKESEFKSKLDEKQRELETERENFESDKNDFQGNWKKQIITLKNLHEIEKQKLQSKLYEERQKLKKEIRTLTQKYEQSMEEQKQNHEQELQEIQSRHYHEVNSLQQCVNSLKHQNQNLMKQRSSLEQKLATIQQQSMKKEAQLQQSLFKAKQDLKSEKITNEAKYGQIQEEKNRFEKQLMSANLLKNQLIKSNEQLGREIQQVKAENNKIKQAYQSNLTSKINEIKQTKEKYMKQISQKETEIALLTQVNRFSQETIKKLTEQKDNAKNNYQLLIKNNKEEFQLEKKKLKEKLMNEKQFTQEKIDKLRRQNGQLQSILSKKTAEYEKVMGTYEQKIKNLQENLMESENNRNLTVSKLKQQLLKEKQNYSKSNAMNKQIITILEQKLSSKQNECNELKNTLDLNDKLAKNQIKHLTEKLEREKIQCREKIINLERNLTDQKMQSKSEKQNQQSTKKQILGMLQRKYLEQIKGLKDEIRNKTKDYEDIKKSNEAIIKQINEKYAFLNQEKQQIEKELRKLKNESSEKQKNFEITMELLKTQISQKQSEFKDEQQKLITSHKKKLQEAEQKCKKMQDEKINACFEKEKQAVKWNMEKLSYESKIDDLKEQKEKALKDQQKLLKDNEKMKAEKKKNTSQIRTDRTFIYARDIPTENKENLSHQ